MRVALIVYELTLNSFDHGEVNGEEIDALGLKKAFLRRPGVECCDILTINTIRFREQFGEQLRYDLVIHFFLPTLVISGATNVLFFQQFFERERHDMRKYLDVFDYVITPGKAESEVLPGVIYFPLAVDPEFYAPKPVSPEWLCDVAFVGNRKMRDLEAYRRFLAPALPYDLRIYGASWDNPEFAEFQKPWKGVLPLNDAPYLYSATKLSLCIHNSEYRDRYQLVTSRAFHALSCNTLVISDPVPEMKRLLPEKMGVIYSEGGAHLSALLKRYLSDDDERTELAECGRKWVLENHTWDHRVEYLAAKLGF